MPDSKKVIEGLKKAAEELARYAPMKVNGRCQMYFDGAIHLLKEQEPVKAIDCRTPYTSRLKDADVVFTNQCGYCSMYILKNWKACPLCGRKIKWDE